MSTEERAFANLANIGPSAAEKAKHAEVQRAIARTMREVVARDSHHDPHNIGPMDKVTPVGAVVAKAVGERWVDPLPLVTPESRSTDAHVQRIADALAPHGAGNPLARERRGPAAEAALAKAVTLAKLAEPEAAPAPPAPEPVLAAPEPEPVAVVARAAAPGTLTRRRLA
jgi:hypothetical protein